VGSWGRCLLSVKRHFIYLHLNICQTVIVIHVCNLLYFTYMKLLWCCLWQFAHLEGLVLVSGIHRRNGFPALTHFGIRLKIWVQPCSLVVMRSEIESLVVCKFLILLWWLLFKTFHNNEVVIFYVCIIFSLKNGFSYVKFGVVSFFLDLT
jgi:hypothetical protein